jgi:hypothetical protein
VYIFGRFYYTFLQVNIYFRRYKSTIENKACKSPENVIFQLAPKPENIEKNANANVFSGFFGWWYPSPMRRKEPLLLLGQRIPG